MAWLILWFGTVHVSAKIPCTAPTGHQLYDVLWAECAKWHRVLKARRPEIGGEIEVKSDRISWKHGPFAVARTSRPDQPEALQGFHDDHVLYVVDEASGVPEAVFQTAEGAMSGDGAITVMAANPTRTSGYFYDSHHRDRARWWTRKVGCEESTRVRSGYLKEMADKYGTDSNVYRVRVSGEFPRSDDDGVIPLELIEAAQARDVLQAPSRMIWGLDVARFGDDRCALAKRRGNIMPEPIKSWAGKDTMQTAGMVVQEYRATPSNERPEVICVDVIGMGAGVVDRLREMNLPVSAVNVAEAASTDDRYMRLRDELWFMARDWFAARDCNMANDDDLAAELSVVKYEITSAGRIKVEAKDKMKKRGLRSPDLADAFVMTFATADFRGEEAEPEMPTFED